MEIIRDGIELCSDCLIFACNGDVSGIDSPAREAEVVAGVAKLGPTLVPAFDSETGDGIREFAHCPCDACGTRLAGSRHSFVILG